MNSKSCHEQLHFLTIDIGLLSSNEWCTLGTLIMNQEMKIINIKTLFIIP